MIAGAVMHDMHDKPCYPGISITVLGQMSDSCYSGQPFGVDISVERIVYWEARLSTSRN